MTTRMLNIATKLGADAFVVQSFNGREELGRLYEYTLELLSEKPDIKPEDLLGTNATVSMEHHDGQSQRYFNGYVTRFSIYGQVSTTAFRSNIGYLYLVTLNPGAWFMTRSSNAQIFSKTAIGDLVNKAFVTPGLMTVENKVSGTETRDFVVQYRETDFNFASRMAEHAGIYYFFKHENGKHTMVLVDKKGDHEPMAKLPQISFSGAERDDTTISAFELSTQVQPGAYATGDYNHVTPNAQITAVHPHSSGHDNDGFETFDFPADTTTSAFVKTYAQIRGEEAACRYAVGRGAGTERHIEVGFKTKLIDHPVAALNQDYLVVAHSFRARNNLSASGGDAASGSDFRCEFQCIPASVQFRPARLAPRPTIAGTQTALVVSDFHTDTDSSGGDDPIGANIGRVRVQFFWDRYGKQSCWARVSTPWAGKNYGFQNMPRVGEEVLVQFLEGDPDRPVVIGRVHNAENMPPFKLPANASITGLKTLSIGPDGKSVAGKWNELRFDDKDGSEQIYVQAQKDYDKRVLADNKIFVGGESHTSVGKDTFHKFGADHHVNTTGDVNEKVGGKLNFDVAQDIHVKSGTKYLVDGGQEVHLKGTVKVVLESSAMVSLVCNGSFISVTPAGIFLSGPMVYVNSGGQAGSGTPANPHAPTEVKAAMTSEGGAPLGAPPAPPTPKAFSPKASSFLLAAQTGAPLVSESCPG